MMILLPLLFSGMTGDVVALSWSGDQLPRTSIFHRGADADIHQISTTDQWYPPWGVTDIPFTPAANAKFSAGVSHLGRSVFYRSTNDHMVQVFFHEQWGWLATDLGLGAGDPVFYGGYPGVDRVVFRLANNHIQEVTWSNDIIVKKDLTALTNAPLATSDPSANIRPDGYNSVVFNTASGVIELYSPPLSSSWFKGGPQSLAGAPNATGRPFEYNRHDGTVTIVYRSVAKIIELRLLPNGWHWSDITAGGEPPAGNPVARVRSDDVDEVVYRSWNGKIIELTSIQNGAWQSWNLTTQYGAPNATTDPTLFSPRYYSFDIVLFGTGTTNVNMLKFDSHLGWSTADLSALAGDL